MRGAQVEQADRDTFLNEDRKERARKAGEAVILELGAGNVKEAWLLVRARDHQHVRSCQWVFVWHHDSSGRALVVRVTADAVGFKRYDKARRTIPVLPPSRARPR